jgi:hypothetical protein
LYICDTWKVAARRITTPIASKERAADVLGVPGRERDKFIRWTSDSILIGSSWQESLTGA